MTVSAVNKDRIFIIDEREPNCPQEALEILKEGNKRFIEGLSDFRNICKNRLNTLKKGQNPHAVVISCSDSRVTPTAIFNLGLGELFEIRVAGNVVDSYGLASLEYAIEHLQTPLVVVIGHENCGVITSAYNELKNNQKSEGNLQKLVGEVKSNIVGCENIEDEAYKNIQEVVKNLKEHVHIKEKMNKGSLDVVGAYYNLNGKVDWLY